MVQYRQNRAYRQRPHTLIRKADICISSDSTTAGLSAYPSDLGHLLKMSSYLRLYSNLWILQY
jgi:hypothetical protein